MDNNQNIDQQQLEDIERYLLQRMDPKERQSFIARLSQDATLKKNTDDLRFLVLGIRESSLQEKLAGFHESLNTSPERKVVPLKRWRSTSSWLMAACTIGILAFSGWWLFFRKSREEVLFSRYYQHDPGLISAMSTTSNYYFDKAMIDYKTGNFAEAIKVWDSLQVTQPNNDTLHYFLGSAYLAAGITNSAIAHLTKVVQLPNSSFLKDADWYLGLAYIKEGEMDKAIPLIEKSGYPEREALLKRLKE